MKIFIIIGSLIVLYMIIGALIGCIITYAMGGKYNLLELLLFAIRWPWMLRR